MVDFKALNGTLHDSPDAVRVEGRQLSWEGLHRAAEAVAARVAGTPAVAIHATPSLETIAAVTGCLLAGVPVVPVPPDSGPLERAHILRDSGAALLLAGVRGTHGGAGGAPAEVGVPLMPVDLADRAPAQSRWPAPAPDTAALILYTSGTTGPPKGVLLGRDAITADLDALAEVWAWTPDDVLAHGLPLYHVHGLVLGVLGALRIGSRLVHVGRPRPERYAAAGARASLYFGVPTIWGRIAADPAAARALRPARLLVSGSAGLPAPVFERLTSLSGHRPVERYGMTETLITVSTRADGDRQAGRVGRPLPGVATRLADDRGGPVPSDGTTIGELQVRGAPLFTGYLGRPDATAAAYTADGWFRTGDAATIGPDGVHRIIGRVSSDLISTGGYRVGAGEVEDALLTHPAVREAAVVGAADADLGQAIVAYVVAEPGTSPAGLIAYVATALSHHKRPRQVHLVPELPRNAMGKVQKAQLLHD